MNQNCAVCDCEIDTQLSHAYIYLEDHFSDPPTANYYCSRIHFQAALGNPNAQKLTDPVKRMTS